ncbi:uncharacterized protein [Rutidosis leptorrhynchoides]|uniref:uncharacterized protein n=1 Tax=Rutidosis leptorrhynchoides TaxID=125765 RepID=UPI003A9A1BB1
MCNVKKTTQIATLLQNTNLIAWDEALMNDKRCFEALDRSLRDILGNTEEFFGGKSVILGGNFKQTLPIQTKGGKSAILGACITTSHLWQRFKGPLNSRWVQIPDQFCIPDDENGLANLISFIYPRESLQNPSAVDLQQKAIVCPKNDAADTINSLIIDMVDGPVTTYCSYDTTTPHGNDGGEVELLYPAEYLNTLNYHGLPLHELHLKKGVPAILLRNINIAGGLCNGTQMIITKMLAKSVEAKIITGTRVGEKVFSPRMSLIHKEPTLPLILKRQQFPLKISYAMTKQKPGSIAQPNWSLSTETSIRSRAALCCAAESYITGRFETAN